MLINVSLFNFFRNNDGRVTMIGGGNLQILDVKYGDDDDDDSDDATYTCRAENDVDSTDAEARLTVLGRKDFMSLCY